MIQQDLKALFYTRGLTQRPHKIRGAVHFEPVPSSQTIDLILDLTLALEIAVSGKSEHASRLAPEESVPMGIRHSPYAVPGVPKTPPRLPAIQRHGR